MTLVGFFVPVDPPVRKTAVSQELRNMKTKAPSRRLRRDQEVEEEQKDPRIPDPVEEDAEDWTLHGIRPRKGSAPMRSEAEILTAMASGSLQEQRALLIELEALRGARTASLQAERDLDLGAEIVADHLTPVLTHEHHTSATDWVLEDDLFAADVPEGDPVQNATVEASMWFGRVSPEVKADRAEFAEQAMGMSRVVAGKYGERAGLAQRAFLDHVGHLHSKTADSASRPWTLNPKDEEWIGHRPDSDLDDNERFWSSDEGKQTQPYLPGYDTEMLKQVREERDRRRQGRHQANEIDGTEAEEWPLDPGGPMKPHIETGEIDNPAIKTGAEDPTVSPHVWQRMKDMYHVVKGDSGYTTVNRWTGEDLDPQQTEEDKKREAARRTAEVEGWPVDPNTMENPNVLPWDAPPETTGDAREAAFRQAYMGNPEPKFKAGDKVYDFRGGGPHTVTHVYKVDTPGKSHRVLINGDKGPAYYEEGFSKQKPKKAAGDSPGKWNPDQSGEGDSTITDYDSKINQEPWLFDDWPVDEETGPPAVHPPMSGAGETTARRAEGGNPHGVGSPAWFDWEHGEGEGHGPYAGTPGGEGFPIRGPLSPEQEAWLHPHQPPSKPLEMEMDRAAKVAADWSMHNPDVEGAISHMIHVHHINPADVTTDPEFEHQRVHKVGPAWKLGDPHTHAASKTAKDEWEQAGEGASTLPQVGVTDPQAEETMWPWEIGETPEQGGVGPSGAEGTGAADVANVPTPGGEAGYPQPKNSKLEAFRARVQRGMAQAAAR